MHSKVIWFLKFIIGFQVVFSSNSSLFLYRNSHYNDLLGPFEHGNQPCTNLSSLLRKRVSSIRTDDCVMAYSGLNCKGYSYRFVAGDYENLATVSHVGGPNMNDYISSIGKCRSSIRGTHVQFHLGTELILEFKNLCERVDIGASYSLATSIDNHDSCIILHLSKKKFTLLAGKSYNSQSIKNIVSYKNPILGISPCHQTEACHVVTLSASVINLTVAESKTNSIASKTSDLAMAATTTFINDGWATVSQEYQATKVITEATEITLVKSFSKINSWKFGASDDVDINTRWLFAVERNIRASILTAYTGKETKTNEESNTRCQEFPKEFSASQKVEIEPCTRYHVDSYIRIKEKYPMEYNVTFEVTGTKGGLTMTANEIRDKLGNLKYIRDENIHTVVVSESNEIYLDFGVETIIEGKGKIIAECRNKQLKTKLLVV